MINHRVRRKGDKLRIEIEFDLSEVQHHAALPAECDCWKDDNGTRTCHCDEVEQRKKFSTRVARYFERVAKDLYEVAAKLLESGELGRVKWFDQNKGYGFITTYKSEDVFVHQTAIAGSGFRTLKPGQPVRFHRREGRETVEAFDVVPLDPSDSLRNDP